jgi:hypothetical protein
MIDAEQPGRIFRVLADHQRYPDAWFLDEPQTGDREEIDARAFTQGFRYTDTSPAVVPVAKPGPPLQFNFAAFDMPVVSTAVAEVVSKLARQDIELFPVAVPQARESYHILNALCRIDCLDEARSEFTRWQKDDHRNDLIGKYRMISTIRIDVSRTTGHPIFRLADWPIALLVSASLKAALEELPNLGAIFSSAS